MLLHKGAPPWGDANNAINKILHDSSSYGRTRVYLICGKLRTQTGRRSSVSCKGGNHRLMGGLSATLMALFIPMEVERWASSWGMVRDLHWGDERDVLNFLKTHWWPEAMACREGVALVLELGLTNVVVETDCKELCSSGLCGAHNSAVSGVLWEISELSLSFEGFSFLFANSVTKLVMS